MIQKGMVAYPTENPIKDPMMESSGIHRKVSGMEDMNCRKMAREPIEMAIISPEMIRSGRLPAMSTSKMDANKAGLNILLY